MYIGNVEINQSIHHKNKMGASFCHGQGLELLKLRDKLLLLGRSQLHLQRHHSKALDPLQHLLFRS